MNYLLAEAMGAGEVVSLIALMIFTGFCVYQVRKS